MNFQLDCGQKRGKFGKMEPRKPYGLRLRDTESLYVNERRILYGI